MDYDVRLSRPAQKQLDGVPREDYRRLHEKLRDLRAAPRPHGCVKLSQELFRIRWGAYRLIYSVLDEEKIVLVLKVARRSEKTYRDLP